MSGDRKVAALLEMPVVKMAARGAFGTSELRFGDLFSASGDVETPEQVDLEWTDYVAWQQHPGRPSGRSC